MTKFVDLDVRPILRAGGEPFDEIMKTVSSLSPGQGLRLFATFKPTPLLHVLGARGFTHETRALDGDEWEVLFSPPLVPADGSSVPRLIDEAVWPEPMRHLDNRDLDPPEPMVRILAATERMATGEVLSAFLCREPIFLFPELAKRGHSWRGGFEPDGKTYKVLVRVGAAKKEAA
ncbi:MAG TPA: DUF2249 domain-containing protein [Pseudolabrys sp.]|nr:DUF2249 domain-containing protein [Pseudolabrys sp.]